MRCGETFPPNLLDERELFADAFVIGAIADESLETHRARQNAVRLAFQNARDMGGIEGRGVGVVFCTNEEDRRFDGLRQNEATADIVGYLHRSLAITAIVGPPSSGATAAAFEVASANGQLIVSPSATSPALTDLEPDASDELPGLLWRTAPPDSLQGQVIASDLSGRMVTNVAMIVQDGNYGNGLADVFESAFDGTVMPFLFSNATERNSAATDAGSGSFEEILFISSQTSDASAFLLFANSFPGYADKEIFLTDSARNFDLLTGARAASALFPRVRGTAPAPIEGTTYDAFQSSYTAEYDRNANAFSFTAHAYDAAWLTLLGALWGELQEQGSFEGRSLARGLRRLSGTGPVPLEGAVLELARSRFRIGEGIDIDGASGALDYDESSEETTASIEVWTIAADGMGFVHEYEVTP